MEHIFDVNRRTALDFVKKAQQFLHLPQSLWECDVEKRNPKLYAGKRGAATIKRSKKCLRICRRVNKDLNLLRKILS